MPNFLYSTSLAKFFVAKDPDNQQTLIVDISSLIDFTIDDFKKATDFKRNHAEDSHNVLILVAILLYPRLIKELSEKNEFQK